MPRWVECQAGDLQVRPRRRVHRHPQGAAPARPRLAPRRCGSRASRVSPRDVVAAVLPDPATVGPRMNGKTCAGLWVTGKGKDGEPRSTYLYHVVDNEWTMREYGHQCVVWQTADQPGRRPGAAGPRHLERRRRARPGGVRRGAVPGPARPSTAARGGWRPLMRCWVRDSTADPRSCVENGPTPWPAPASARCAACVHGQPDGPGHRPDGRGNRTRRPRPPRGTRAGRVRRGVEAVSGGTSTPGGRRGRDGRPGGTAARSGRRRARGDPRGAVARAARRGGRTRTAIAGGGRGQGPGPGRAAARSGRPRQAVAAASGGPAGRAGAARARGRSRRRRGRPGRRTAPPPRGPRSSSPRARRGTARPRPRAAPARGEGRAARGGSAGERGARAPRAGAVRAGAVGTSGRPDGTAERAFRPRVSRRTPRSGRSGRHAA